MRCCFCAFRGADADDRHCAHCDDCTACIGGLFDDVSVLAIVLTPDREAILFYILFFGYYPTLYGLLMRIKRKPLRVLAKFGVFNLAMALETALAVWVLQIPLSEMEVFGKWSIPILAVMLNVVFVLYDYSMNGLIVLYIRRLHPLVQKYIK